MRNSEVSGSAEKLHVLIKRRVFRIIRIAHGAVGYFSLHLFKIVCLSLARWSIHYMGNQPAKMSSVA